MIAHSGDGPAARPATDELPPAAEDPDQVEATIRDSGLFDSAYYERENPDVGQSGMGALEHFCELGWKQGKRPNPYFEPAWYLRGNPGAAASGGNPLWHYIVSGERQGRWPGPLFDPEYYARAYSLPDGPAGALADYLSHLDRGEWRNPVELFDVDYYLDENPDIREKGIDPVFHYVVQGHKEGRNPSRRFVSAYYRTKHLRGDLETVPLIHHYESRMVENHYESRMVETVYAAPGTEQLPSAVTAQIRHWSNPGPFAEEFDPGIAAGHAARAKLIAFYLPQFHAIPENDRWWGPGFTEWRNVMRGAPRFVDHYQPRIPRELGFYDLTDGRTMRRQVELASQAGIHGFAFYYYWFNRKRLLEKPIEAFLEDPSIDFPFCVIWANENWSRRWDGGDRDILIEQEYDPDDDEALVDELQRHFADPRYIRIDGRPLFLIYRVDVIPKARRTIKRWRALWRARHGEEPLIFLAQTFKTVDPRKLGLDGAVEFPPHKLAQVQTPINDHIEILDPEMRTVVHDYEVVAADALADPYPDFPLVKTVVPSWDNDARLQGDGLMLHGSTPERYEAWLRGAAACAEEHPVYGERLVFVNAWNEWAEAAYLEPDVHYGAAYLNATARAICEPGPLRPPALEPEPAAEPSKGNWKILLVGHDAEPFGAQMIIWHVAEVLRSQFGCEIAWLLRAGGPMLPKLEQQGVVNVVDEELDNAGELVERFRADGYELAITNSARSGEMLPYLKGAGFSVISLVHELPGAIEDYDLAHRLRQIVELSDAPVVPAEAVADQLSTAFKLKRKRFVVRPQGLYKPIETSPEAAKKIRRELGIPADCPIALNVGAGDLRKGLDIFLQAAKLAVAERSNLHFVWVGKPHLHIARWLDRDLVEGLAERVHFVPYTEDVSPYYAAADVFFLSSREDPFPSVALEALSVGLPLVALSGSGGMEPLAAEHGEIVDRNDTPGILRALSEAAGETDLGARERRARAVSEKFRYDDYCFDLLRLRDPEFQKLSVVVPNYNYADYLAGRLNSIFEQTHPIFELIVLDDYSDDTSLTELERITEETGRRFSVVVNERNSGSTFRQWAKACELARGDYIWIAEADDLNRPTFVESVLGQIREEDFAFGFTDSAQVDERGKQIGASYKDYYRRSVGSLMDRDFKLDGKSFVRRCLAERNLVLSASSVIWRRESLAEALDRCREELDSYRVVGDWHLYAAAALAGGRVAYSAKPLSIHRRHPGGVTEGLDRRLHLAEVRRVHSSIASWLSGGKKVRARMDAYQAELRDQFGLGA